MFLWGVLCGIVLTLASFAMLGADDDDDDDDEGDSEGQLVREGA